MILSRKIKRQGLYVIVGILVLNVIIYYMSSEDEATMKSDELKDKIHDKSLRYLHKVMEEKPILHKEIIIPKNVFDEGDVHPYMAVVLMNLLKKVERIEAMLNITAKPKPKDEVHEDNIYT